MTKIKGVSSLLTGAVAIVSGCSALLFAGGAPVSDLLRSFRADGGMSFKRQVRSSGDASKNSWNWGWPFLPCYGYGHDAVSWGWSISSRKLILLRIYLSAAALRYYYSSLILYPQRLHTLFTQGTCPMEQTYLGSKYVWSPYLALSRLFDTKAEAKFIKSWRHEIDDEDNVDILKKAWEESLGVKYYLTVGIDGSVIGKGGMVADVEHKKGKVSEGGVNGVVGNNGFPGNRLKIFLDAKCAKIITDNLDTPDKFWKWLWPSDTAIYGFPAASDLRYALKYEGEWISDGVGVPVWGKGYERTRDIRSLVLSHLSDIRKVAKDAQSSSGSKGTGMMISIRKTSVNSFSYKISKQSEPTNDKNIDKFDRTGNLSDLNRAYTCSFGWKSCAEFYQIPKANHFYNALTNYEGSTAHAWSLGTKFRESELSNDLDDIQEIINGTKPEEYVLNNKYKSYTNFRLFLQKSIWLQHCVRLKFYVWYDDFYKNTFSTDLSMI